MKLLLFTILVSWASAQKCPGIFFNYRCYEIEIIKEGISNIHQLVFNDNDNTLYFTFDQIARTPSRALGFFNIDDESAGVIDGIRNATAVTIDKRRNRIYVGGSDGLFFLHQNKVPEKLPVNDNIINLFFKDVVYFVNRRRQAYKFDYGNVTPLQETNGEAVDKLIVDDDNNILFVQNRKLFRVKIGTRAINTHERYIVDVLTTDYLYKPYVCATSGVYVYNKYKYALDKVANIYDLRELTFTKQGEPIYAVVDNIVKLNYNPIPYIP
ncbi:ommochrome-binding protein-like [Anticarsia gemmatalis]|uniref:ommochrome-binding protein-like n=1 Tax=Anticarsia gemmatalis TaxID=129554 RepID=UPI003F75F6C9